MKKSLFKIFSLVLVALFSLVAVGCEKDNNEPEKASITFAPEKTTLTYGESIKLNVNVTGVSNTKYAFTISDPQVVSIQGDTLTVAAEGNESKTVTVVVYSVVDPSAMATKVFTIVKPSEIKVEITTNRNTITYGETITLNAVVSGLENKAYSWVVSNPELVEINQNVLSVKSEVKVDTVVTIKAIAVENQNVYAEKKITIKAPSSFGSITISSSADSIKEGETILLSANVTGLEDTRYTWTVSDESLIQIVNDVVSLVGTVNVDTNVTITCTAVADESVFKSKTIVVKAPVVEGQVGELTNEVLAEIANPNITINGVITDYFEDFNNSFNSSQTSYDSVVMMSDGRWYGQWNAQGRPNNIMTDNYRKGTQDGLADAYGNVGHAMERLFINKNNLVEAKAVTDYRSIPAIWEAQHLWNHLGNLVVTNFTYSPDDELYTYTVDPKDMDALYLMTYLAYSLTPMLEDTFHQISFVIENGHITKIIARTEILYNGGETTAEEADYMSYTEVEFTLSNIGTTVVPNPTPYEAPEYAELLENALQNMQGLTNYQYNALDTSTYAPSIDPDDYEYEMSASTTSGVTAKLAHRNSLIANKVHNYQATNGVVGEVGRVTSNAILIENTGKYNAAEDGKIYHVEYYGYKQNADNTYDEFEYSSSIGGFYGTRKLSGTLADVLPTFNFSANIFEFVGTKGSGDDINYIFQLKATDATRELALEVSMHSYAEDAIQSTDKTFNIVVNNKGQIVSTEFAYSLSDVYFGYITTTYSNFGTTELPADTFEGYVPRVWASSWEELAVKYYQPTHTGPWVEANALEVLTHIFGEEQIANLPSPEIFVRIFDDIVYGPFFDWRTTEVDGQTIYKDYMSINVVAPEYDENSVIVNYDGLMEELVTALQEVGYELDLANTDTTGGAIGISDKYVTLYKGDIQIVIQNNHTKNLSIYFYHLGDWILK